MPSIKTIFLIIESCVVLVLVGLGWIGYYANKNLSGLIREQEEEQKQEEIKKIQELVQKAIETGEKEPLITINKNGFSQRNYNNLNYNNLNYKKF